MAFFVCTNLGFHTLEGLGRPAVDSRSTSVVPLKSLGYNGSNELLGRSVASKLWVHEPDTFFLEAAREISEKWNFFVNRSVPENFGRENFSGQVPTESLRTQDSEYVYERWVQQIFDPVLVARSWVSATKWGPLAKL